MALLTIIMQNKQVIATALKYFIKSWFLLRNSG